MRFKEKRIEIRKQNLEGENGTRNSPTELNAAVTGPILEPATLPHATVDLRDTMVTKRDPVLTESATPVVTQHINVTLNPVDTTPNLNADDLPMADDDQLNEERFAVHAIMHWLKCQELKSITLKLAEALDLRHAVHGLESMNDSDTWNRLAVDLLALYHIGDSSWMLGLDLWGPAKGMVKDMMLKTVRRIRQNGMYEFDNTMVEIPKRQPGRQSDDNTTGNDFSHSPQQHHRSHLYKFFRARTCITGSHEEGDTPG